MKKIDPTFRKSKGSLLCYLTLLLSALQLTAQTSLKHFEKTRLSESTFAPSDKKTPDFTHSLSYPIRLSYSKQHQSVTSDMGHHFITKTPLQQLSIYLQSNIVIDEVVMFFPKEQIENSLYLT